ncbi:hypothetical protein [Mycobacterium hubeiense]|uniref:hypothetical protein n=1 Tax=Mycobacterium hubeiense TaxID=1867256 RepID=UPI000C7EFFF2|nr:hypothetical protein [Mycobacterium sp. QGD 101]
MNLKKIAATVAATGALAFGAVAGAGSAQADDKWWWDPVPPPGHISHLPFVPPPGHISHLPFVPPPGHWDKPWKWVK